jgi:hypothetical protein
MPVRATVRLGDPDEFIIRPPVRKVIDPNPKHPCLIHYELSIDCPPSWCACLNGVDTAAG